MKHANDLAQVWYLADMLNGAIVQLWDISLCPSMDSPEF